MSDKIKKLTSKNLQDFEPVVYDLINNPNVELFAELVEKDDFLFDFVKANVATRMTKVCNSSNYMNLLNFLPYYSPSYEEFIVATLAKYADEDLTDKMLEIFEKGSIAEKTYCARFFSYIKDSLALDLLNRYAFDENSNLSANCAATLAELNDRKAFDKAIVLLEDNDEFLRLSAVKFLVSYGDKSAVPYIISAMKKSSFAENIAGEIPYLCNLFELYKLNKLDCLFIINHIISALGEILGLSQVFDFSLYEMFEKLINGPKTSEVAVVLLNAIDKFATLTENDEYLFDETKDTKQEIFDIKALLNSIDVGELYSLSDKELRPESMFVYTALDFTENEKLVRSLLTANNPTIILRALEVLKQIDILTNEDKTKALEYISDTNIKNIILAI